MLELIEVILESILALVSPEKTAEKVKKLNAKKSSKGTLLIILFTLIYVAAIVLIAFFLAVMPNVLFRAFAIILIIFLLYCLFIFYHKVYKY